jgi:hypothetical protein
MGKELQDLAGCHPAIGACPPLASGTRPSSMIAELKLPFSCARKQAVALGRLYARPDKEETT